jgi:hypothetical protein
MRLLLDVMMADYWWGEAVAAWKQSLDVERGRGYREAGS